MHPLFYALAVQSDEAQLSSHPIVHFARWLNGYYVGGYHRFRSLTPCPLPGQGAGILVCNHISALDPVLLQSISPRTIVWMIAREYTQIPVLRWFFQVTEAIPVERSGRDVVATRAALRALENGRIVGMFPEGRISTTDQILPFHEGVGLLAAHSGALVYPACIEGSMRGQGMVEVFLRSNTATVAFGEPLQIEAAAGSREVATSATLSIRQAVLGLRERLAEFTHSA